MEQQKKPGRARRTVAFVGKAWAYSLGITSVKRELGRIGSNAATVGTWALRQLRSSPADYRHESFAEAIDRLGLAEEDLIRQARAFNLRAHSWLAALFLAAAWFAGAAWSDAPASHTVLCFGAMFLAFSKAITFRFRFCQCRDTELYAFWPWFFSPGRW